MKQSFFSVILIVVLLAFTSKGMTQGPLTLKQCIETGIANNLDVLQRELQSQSDRANWKQSRLNVFPDLNANAGHSFNQGRSIDPYTNSPITQSFNSSSYGISSNVVLFNGLAIHHNTKQNALTYQAASMEWQQEKDNLTINIILAYLQVLSNADQLEQARNQHALSGKQVERLQVLNDQGAVRPSLLSDLKGQLAGDQLAIINAQNSLETSKVNLSRLMNVPYNKDINLEKILPESFAATYESAPDSIYQAALENLALIKAVDLRKQSAARGVKVARGQLWPTLSFGGSASTRYSSVARQNQYVNTVYGPTSDSAIINNVRYPVFSYQDKFTDLTKIGYMDQLDNNLYTSFGFNLSIPIFNSLVQRNRVKQAGIRLRSAELVANTTRTQLSQDIELAFVNMTSAADRYKVLLEQVSAFDESFRAAGILFQQGVGTSIDYLTAKNNLDRASINLIIARYDYVLRMKILDYYQGKQLW
ncbi:MAG: TolC family protein [Chitinophagaceae bacterium]|nr:TolC family protein [Chitinophagaceae bacterium]